MEVRAKKRFRTISEGEKIRKGLRRSYMYWDESKEAKRGTSVWAWTQFYHKPYSCDWQQAYNKACERKWRYME